MFSVSRATLLATTAVVGFVFGMHLVLDDKTVKLYKHSYGTIMDLWHFYRHKNNRLSRPRLEAGELRRPRPPPRPSRRGRWRSAPGPSAFQYV